MNESTIGRFAVELAWPVVVLLGVVIFFCPLRRILIALAGFVGRSRYCVGDAPTIGQICVKNVFTCLNEDKVRSKLKEMNKRGYSFAPIVDEKECVCAVFTPQCVARIATGEVTVDENTTFGKLLQSDKEVAKLADVTRFRFVAKGDAGVVASLHFRNLWKSKEDFDVFLVTKSGCANEPLLGMVSVWDAMENDGLVNSILKKGEQS